MSLPVGWLLHRNFFRDIEFSSHNVSPQQSCLMMPNYIIIFNHLLFIQLFMSNKYILLNSFFWKVLRQCKSSSLDQALGESPFFDWKMRIKSIKKNQLPINGMSPTTIPHFNKYLIPKKLELVLLIMFRTTYHHYMNYIKWFSILNCLFKNLDQNSHFSSRIGIIVDVSSVRNHTL